MVDAGQEDAGQPPDPDPGPDPGPGAGQLRLPFALDDESGCGAPIVVRPGDAPTLVARFVQAQHYADEVRRALDQGGLGGQLLTITPSVNEQGNPCVHLEFTPDGAQALLQAFIHAAPPGVTWAYGDPAA